MVTVSDFSTAARVAWSLTGVPRRRETACPTPTTAPSPGAMLAVNVLAAGIVETGSGRLRVAPELSRTWATTAYVAEGTSGVVDVHRPSAPTVPATAAPLGSVPAADSRVASATDSTSGVSYGAVPSGRSPR